MKNGVILYVKNEDRLNKSVLKFLRNDDIFNKEESKEIFYLTQEFAQKGFIVYLSNFENVNETTLFHKHVFNTDNKSFCDLNIDLINDNIAVILPRMLGSIEKQRDRVCAFFQNLKLHFKGFVINDPDTVIYGLKKNYLKDLAVHHINVPHTDIYDSDLSYEYVKNKYNNGGYIIKPLTGELGNSVELVSDVNQNFFNHKRDKVGGWIIQPFYETIWLGERQYLFVDNKLIYGYLKGYNNVDNDTTKLPRLKNISFQQEFKTRQSDVELCKNTLCVLNEKLNYHTYICRFDIIDDFKGDPMILECELINPSFRSWYIQLVAKKIVEFIVRKIS